MDNIRTDCKPRVQSVLAGHLQFTELDLRELLHQLHESGLTHTLESIGVPATVPCFLTELPESSHVVFVESHQVFDFVFVLHVQLEYPKVLYACHP